ncbi:ABC transporter substrate-binding protein [Marmoricola endophyticus]|uniref:ABC transporter substrate-binding protein n=1 Tax=Marmoricola endophyticus TaxID=2040280 RepID=A0A917BLM5_9ACTN|nr:helical backbone metal receptor [Marmoricola endophyticus]GGF50578.1 ABC transporter substrate-binding protein [Marmoricola endophyticus]
MHDDLGADVPLERPPRRVVSLVPSLTETLAPLGVVVGATDWCTHPADLDVPRVRGTKNPDRAAILDLAPDLVVANKEENRELDVRRLREAGVPVWVTDISTVPEALASIRRLVGDALGLPVPGWVDEAEPLWARPPGGALAGQRVVVPIWRDPWMAVGGDSFTSDVLRRLGAENVLDDAARYPTVELVDIDRVGVLALLPDEPYAFAADDGPEAFLHAETRLVSGRLLTWYGPSLVEAHLTLTGEDPR